MTTKAIRPRDERTVSPVQRQDCKNDDYAQGTDQAKSGLKQGAVQGLGRRAEWVPGAVGGALSPGTLKHGLGSYLAGSGRHYVSSHTTILLSVLPSTGSMLCHGDTEVSETKTAVLMQFVTQ